MSETTVMIPSDETPYIYRFLVADNYSESAAAEYNSNYPADAPAVGEFVKLADLEEANKATLVNAQTVLQLDRELDAAKLKIERLTKQLARCKEQRNDEYYCDSGGPEILVGYDKELEDIK